MIFAKWQKFNCCIELVVASLNDNSQFRRQAYNVKYLET